MTREILEKIIGNFSRDELAVFFRKKSTKFTQKMEPLDGYDGDKFGKFEVLGEIELKDRFKLVVVAVEKNDSLTERDSRKKQFELAKKIMQERFAFHAAAIFVFHDKKGSFRFSLIHRQYKGTKAEFGPFRRFTYFVSPQESNRTFLDRIGLASFESLDEIKEAFSVERVNKEFYNRIAASFYALVGKEEQKGLLKYPKQDKRKEFAVRLIGRIVFCWFLKKKNAKKGSLIPNDLLSSMAVNAFPDYYHTVLEPLFFEVLNTPMKERDNDFLESKGITSLVKTIPFLNGGLFDPNESDDFFRRNGGITQSYGIIDIPDEWFSDLFMTFEQYNFTIDENIPVDVELSIDPEMLGRIFENLLAEINPETGETARKQSGSFYTPRPIVEYMVDESLKAYLVSKTGIEESRVNALLSYNDGDIPVLTEVEKHLIMDALDTMNVLDPACGSGAFPMGVLQKAVLILERVDPDSMNWVIKIVNKIKDPKEKKKRTEELLQEDWVYRHKLGIIQNCIYGVDIQQIAVEISKLRFFLSLVVDASTDHEIKPLPNLEFKFVCANTLIALKHQQYKEADVLMKGSYTQASLFDVDIPALLNQMREMREEYFGATAKEKGRLKTKIRDVQSKLLMHLLPMGADSAALKLSKWDAFSHEKAEFFDPEWMFGVKDGFDIVIGNPPYVRIQTLKQTVPEQVSEFKELYTAAAKGNYDLYVVFVERGLQLLNKRGQLAFILPHKFFNAQYGAPLREVLSKGKHLRHIVHFGDQQIFPGATNYVCLLFLANDGSDTCQFVGVNNISDWLTSLRGEEGTIPAHRVTGAEWNFTVGKSAGLFEKLQQMPVKLGDEVDIFVGLQTSADDVFIMNFVSETARTVTLESKALDCHWTFEKDLLHPVVSGTDVSAYGALSCRQFILFPYQVTDEQAQLIPLKKLSDAWPRTADYLKANKQRLEKRERGKFKDGDWHRFGRSQNLGIQQREKLCVPRLVEHLHAAPDFDGLYFLDNVDVGGLTYTDSATKHHLAYLLALLNSRLLRWYFPYVSAPFRGGWHSANKQFLSLVPFRPIDFGVPTERAEHDAIVALVEKIMTVKQSNPNAPAVLWEREIDEKVYRLYGLTKDEIKMVEGNYK